MNVGTEASLTVTCVPDPDIHEAWQKLRAIF